MLPLDGLVNEPRQVAARGNEGGKPWGPWATIGFGVLLSALWIAVQTIAAVVLTSLAGKGRGVMAQGWILAGATIIAAPVFVGGSALLAGLRRGIGVGAYLGLGWPPAWQALRWSLILLGVVVATDLLSLALGRPLVPESMIAVYQTAGSLPVFLFGIVVAGPLAEEFLFRGFLLPGLRNSRLGLAGAIALTALAWASLHVQYDLYGMASVAVSGVVLGLIRSSTGSLWLCVLLHGFMNIIASVESLFILSGR